jgi:hypothetical protein
MKVNLQWLLAIAALSALLVWGPRAYAQEEPKHYAGEVMSTSVVCNEMSIRMIVDAMTQGKNETEQTIIGVLGVRGCAMGSFNVRIVKKSFRWEDWEGDVFQAWEIQPAMGVAPPYPTFTWEHVGGPSYPSGFNPGQNPTSRGQGI